MTGSGVSVKIVDGALAGCVFVVPLLMAGRHPLGQAVLVILSATAAMAWLMGQASCASASFRPTWAAPFILGGLLILIVQIVPLPETLLDRLSPEIARLLPMWRSETPPSARLGVWQTLSLNPAASRDGLVLFSAYALLFLVAVQRGERLEDVERLLRWCATAAAFVGIYGLIQCLTSNGKFFWFYEDPTTTTFDVAKANFTTRNHFAAFLSLGVGPLLWWVQAAFGNAGSPKRHEPRSLGALHRVREAGRVRHPITGGSGLDPLGATRENLAPYVLAGCLALVLFAGLLSLSRGGMVAIAIALALTTALSWRSWSRNWFFFAALTGAIGVVAMMLAIFGFEKVNRRVDDFRSASLERLDHLRARRSIWTAVARGIRQFTLIGTGVGAHVEAYPIYYSTELYRDIPDQEFTHAESSYLHLGFETGLSGLALLGGFMACCGMWCIGGMIRAPSVRVATALAAVTGSLAATAVHALVDFIWYVPACVAMILLLAACAANLWRHGHRKPVSRGGRSAARACPAVAPGWRLPRLAYLAGLAILAPTTVWAVQDQLRSAWAEGPWNEYRRSLAHSNVFALPDVTADPSNHAQARDEAREAEARRVEWLRQVVERYPDRARAHLRLAQSCVRLFELIQMDQDNPMRVADVRDAALRSRFAARAALDDWLRHALGDHARYLDLALRHARRAVALCPLQGHAYLYLAELSFLENASESWKKACVDQALRVRPYDGDVLDTAAAEAIAAGDYDHWVELVARLLRCGKQHQRRWIERLVRNTAAEAMPDMFQAFVQTFQPDAETLRILVASGQTRARPDQLVWLRLQYAERAAQKAQTQRGIVAASWWCEAQKNYAATGKTAQALQCARNAATADPQNFEARWAMGTLLLGDGRPREAEPHLRWCVERRPGDAVVEARWKEAVKRRMDEQAAIARRSTPPPPR